jgi:hypothetical protein
MIRVIIMRFIRDWLKNEHLVITNDVLSTMNDIAGIAAADDARDSLKKLAREVREAISVKVKF